MVLITARAGWKQQRTTGSAGENLRKGQKNCEKISLKKMSVKTLFHVFIFCRTLEPIIIDFQTSFLIYTPSRPHSVFVQNREAVGSQSESNTKEARNPSAILNWVLSIPRNNRELEATVKDTSSLSPLFSFYENIGSSKPLPPPTHTHSHLINAVIDDFSSIFQLASCDSTFFCSWEFIASITP